MSWSWPVRGDWEYTDGLLVKVSLFLKDSVTSSADILNVTLELLWLFWNMRF